MDKKIKKGMIPIYKLRAIHILVSYFFYHVMEEPLLYIIEGNTITIEHL